MKILDKIALILFSTIILIISIITALLIFGWLDVLTVTTFINFVITDGITSNVILGVLVVFILLAIKAIFFTSSEKQNGSFGNGILLQNENGKLLISKETIQNIVNGVAKEFESAQEVSTDVRMGQDKSLNIEVTLYVAKEAIIKDLSNNLQLKIKDVIKKSIDVDVKQVDIRIKNITQKVNNVQE